MKKGEGKYGRKQERAYVCVSVFFSVLKIEISSRPERRKGPYIYSEEILRPFIGSCVPVGPQFRYCQISHYMVMNYDCYIPRYMLVVEPIPRRFY